MFLSVTLSVSAALLDRQVEVANVIFEVDKKRSGDSVTRGKVEALVFECGYKFLVNKNFPVTSKQFELIREVTPLSARGARVIKYVFILNVRRLTVLLDASLSLSPSPIFSPFSPAS